MVQKLTRAVESENQLPEVMTDFWFNHFNVSLTDNKARPYLLPYERDAIRPNALGRFRDLLEATAKQPGHAALPRQRPAPRRRTARPPRWKRWIAGRAGRSAMEDQPARMRRRGVNENYARELMELHTLGVDGGYTQQDVVEVARAFTGWTLLPPRQGRRAGREPPRPAPSRPAASASTARGTSSSAPTSTTPARRPCSA